MKVWVEGVGCADDAEENRHRHENMAIVINISIGCIRISVPIMCVLCTYIVDCRVPIVGISITI